MGRQAYCHWQNIESARKMLWVTNTRTQSTDSRNRFTHRIFVSGDAAAVVSIVAAATCCQNRSSRWRCVHTRYQYDEKNLRLGCATEKKLFKPPTTSFQMLCERRMCCMRSSRPLTNIGPEYAHTKNVSAFFSPSIYLFIVTWRNE